MPWLSTMAGSSTLRRPLTPALSRRRERGNNNPLSRGNGGEGWGEGVTCRDPAARLCFAEPRS
jgi:hypothetical protein